MLEQFEATARVACRLPWDRRVTSICISQMCTRKRFYRYGRRVDAHRTRRPRAVTVPLAPLWLCPPPPRLSTATARPRSPALLPALYSDGLAILHRTPTPPHRFGPDPPRTCKRQRERADKAQPSTTPARGRRARRPPPAGRAPSPRPHPRALQAGRAPASSRTPLRTCGGGSARVERYSSERNLGHTSATPRLHLGYISLHLV